MFYLANTGQVCSELGFLESSQTFQQVWHKWPDKPGLRSDSLSRNSTALPAVGYLGISQPWAGTARLKAGFNWQLNTFIEEETIATIRRRKRWHSWSPQHQSNEFTGPKPNYCSRCWRYLAAQKGKGCVWNKRLMCLRSLILTLSSHACPAKAFFLLLLLQSLTASLEQMAGKTNVQAGIWNQKRFRMAVIEMNVLTSFSTDSKETQASCSHYCHPVKARLHWSSWKHIICPDK